MRIQILLPQPALGLLRDAEVLERLISDAGGVSTVTVAAERPLSRQAWDRARHACGRSRFDLNVFLEVPVGRWINSAPVSVLVPNQEWFQRSHVRWLARMDRVLCKTLHAERVFKGLGDCGKVVFTGFAGADRRDTAITPDFDAFLHIAGSAWRTETRTVLEAWSRHPEWPVLTVVNGAAAETGVPPNVRMVPGPLTDGELRTIQNRCGVHVCPSEMEGYGHLLSEGASVGSLVLTTDAEPMHELISADRGVLIPTVGFETHHHGVRYRFMTEAVEAGVGTILGMDLCRRAALGRAGRAWFEQNRAQASERLVREILAAGRGV